MFAPEFSNKHSANTTKTPKTPCTMRTQNNIVRLIGNLGHAPEVREIAPGRKVARISVATNESYTNGTGERVTDTQWHTVVAWGRMAEVVERLLAKGSSVVVEGRLQYRSYPDKDGLKRYVTEVVLGDLKVLATGQRQPGAEARAAA